MKFFHQYNDQTFILHNNKLRFEPHLHPELEIIIMFKGEGSVIINNKEFFIKNGDFVIVFPNMVHEYKTDSVVEVGKFIFLPDFIPDFNVLLKNQMPHSPVISSENAQKSNLHSLAREIIERYDISSPPVKNAYLALLTGKILELCELEEKKRSEHNTVSAVFEYCQNNYRNNITQKEVAKALHISESYLSHIFCCKMKVNFRSYINILRINEACRLILQNDKNINDIVEESGFSSIRSFNRAFIKNTGLTPTQYRKKLNCRTNSNI